MTEEEFINACKSNDLDKVREYIATGNRYGLLSALLEAVKAGSTDVVLELLSVPYVTRGRNNLRFLGGQVFRAACRKGDLKVVKAMLAIPHVRENAHRISTSDNSSPLGAACFSKNAEVVKSLLELPNVKIYASAGGNMALAEACIFGNQYIVDMLLQLPNVKATRLINAFIYACEYGSEDAARTFLEIDKLRAEVEKYITLYDSFYPLTDACKLGKLGVVNALLSFDKINAIAHKDKVVRAACSGGNLEIFNKILALRLSRGMGLSSVEGLLNAACKGGNVYILSRVSCAIAPVTVNEMREGLKCISYGDIKTAKWLLQSPDVRKVARRSYRTLMPKFQSNIYLYTVAKILWGSYKELPEGIKGNDEMIGKIRAGAHEAGDMAMTRTIVGEEYHAKQNRILRQNGWDGSVDTKAGKIKQLRREHKITAARAFNRKVPKAPRVLIMKYAGICKADAAAAVLPKALESK